MNSARANFLDIQGKTIQYVKLDKRNDVTFLSIILKQNFNPNDGKLDKSFGYNKKKLENNHTVPN